MATTGRARDASSQYSLCVLYYAVPPGLHTARQWFEKAASWGMAKAQNFLGVMFLNGRVAPQDYGQARVCGRKRRNRAKSPLRLVSQLYIKMEMG
jgi:TPR repeat protein